LALGSFKIVVNFCNKYSNNKVNLIKLFEDFFNLLYPERCVSCENNLRSGEKILCTLCLSDLPRTNYHLDNDNEVARMFWGRIKIERATAYYFFQKGGQVQAILHKFKYNSQTKIGYYLGRMAGNALINSYFNDIDLIIPVPLHEAQYKKRGFNQSEIIAKGLAKGMGKPLDKKTLYRIMANPTQTRKHRYERWVNVKGIFALCNSEMIENKHILLVDDVVTTGATLEACATTLLKVKNVKVSVFALAKA